MCDKARDVVKRAALINGCELKVQTLHPDKATEGQNEDQKKSEKDLCRDILFNFGDKSSSFYRLGHRADAKLSKDILLTR